MWGKFGKVVFQLLQTPESFRRSSRAKFARISLFSEKEKLHFTGLEAEAVELSIKLHHLFCSPAEEVEKLKEYLISGESQLLIIGDYLKGRFVIENINEEVIRTDQKGNPLVILLNLSLREDAKDADNTTANRI